MQSLNIFGSTWHVPFPANVLANRTEITLDPAEPSEYEGIPYPFGLDPIWQLATNKVGPSGSWPSTR